MNEMFFATWRNFSQSHAGTIQLQMGVFDHEYYKMTFSIFGI